MTTGNCDFVWEYSINTIFANGHYYYSAATAANATGLIRFNSNQWDGYITNVHGYNYTLVEPLSIANGYFNGSLTGWAYDGWEFQCLSSQTTSTIVPTSMASGIAIHTVSEDLNEQHYYLIELDPSHVEPTQVTSNSIFIPNCASYAGIIPYPNNFIKQTIDNVDDVMNDDVILTFDLSGITTGSLDLGVFGIAYNITSAGTYTYNVNATDTEIAIYASSDFDGYVTNFSGYNNTTSQVLNIYNADFSLGNLSYWTVSGWTYGFETPISVNVLSAFTAGKLILPAGVVNLNAATKYHVASGTTTALSWFDFTGSSINTPIINSNYDYYEITAYYGGHNISTALTSSETITFELDECDKKGIEYYRLGWFNEGGGWDFYNFTLLAQELVNVDRGMFLKNNFSFNGNAYTTDASKRGMDLYRMDAQKKITVNSNWLTEEEVTVLNELRLSPSVYWLNNPSENIETAIVILTEEFEIQKHSNGKLMRVQCSFLVSNFIPTQI